MVGDTITVQVHFNLPISVTGTPQLTLIIGETERTANYVLTSSAIMAFNYTVVAGDTDTDGASVKTNSLALNNGTITTTPFKTGAVLKHSAKDGGNSHIVDTTVPTVSSVAVSSTGPYIIGSNIDVTVTMSENVNVTGTPQITLVVGTTEKTASYTSGTGTTELVFRYAVTAGDADTDGVSVKVNSLALNSGTLKDAAANDLTLTHSGLADGITT